MDEIYNPYIMTKDQFLLAASEAMKEFFDAEIELKGDVITVYFDDGECFTLTVAQTFLPNRERFSIKID